MCEDISAADRIAERRGGGDRNENFASTAVCGGGRGAGLA